VKILNQIYCPFRFKENSAALGVVFFAVFLDLIGFGIIMPLLPLYSARFGASGFMIGIIAASFSGMQFLFSPFWGRMSDRLGRRPVMLVSLAGGVLSYALFAVASMVQTKVGLWVILFSRVFAGCCAGNMSVAQTYIADLTAPELRSARMGLIGIAFGLGFIIGSAIGAFGAKFGLSVPGWIATVLCTVNFIVAFLILPETGKNTSVERDGFGFFRRLNEVFRYAQIRHLSGLFFISTFCFACYETTLALLSNRLFQFNETQVGFLFALTGAVSVIVQGLFLKKLVAWFKERALITISFFFMGLSLCLLPFSFKPVVMFGLLILLAIGSSLNRPPIFGLISIVTPLQQQGLVLGVNQSVGSLARIIGPIVAASLFDIDPALPYIFAGLTSLGAAFFNIHLRQTQTKSSDAFV